MPGTLKLALVKAFLVFKGAGTCIEMFHLYDIHFVLGIRIAKEKGATYRLGPELEITYIFYLLEFFLKEVLNIN